MNLQQGKWFSVTGMNFQQFCAANAQALQVLAEKIATDDMPADEIQQRFCSLELHNTSWEKLNHADHNSLTKWLSNRMRGVAVGKEFDSHVTANYSQIFKDAGAASRKHCRGKLDAGDIVSTFYVRMKSGILTGKDTWEKAPKSPASFLRYWIWVRLCLICRELCKKRRGRDDVGLLPEDFDVLDCDDPFDGVQFWEGADHLSELSLEILYRRYWVGMSLRRIAKLLALPYETVLNEHKEAIRILQKHLPED
jgi:DNA-directed RNA polymerase specialized sigma24 family protein